MNLFTQTLTIFVFSFFNVKKEKNIVAVLELNKEQKEANLQLKQGDITMTNSFLASYMRELRKADVEITKLVFIGGNVKARKAFTNLARFGWLKGKVAFTLPNSLFLDQVREEVKNVLDSELVDQLPLITETACRMCGKLGYWKDICPSCNTELNEIEKPKLWRVWVRGFTPGDTARVDQVFDGFKTKAAAIAHVRGMKVQGFFISSGKEKPIYSEYEA